MSPHQAVAVAVRVLAVWLAIYVVRTIPAFFVEGRGDASGLLAAAIVALLSFVLALLLWFFPLTIARKLLSSPASDPAPTSSPDLWLAMGCALIGLWLLASSVPALVRDALVLYYAGSHYDDTTAVRHWIVYNLLQIVIALWLVFGAKGFRQAFWWARNAGLHGPSNNRSSGP